MKRLFTVLLFALNIISYAQSRSFQSTSYAYKSKTNKGWGQWSKKIQTKVLITIDEKNEELRIDSDIPQRYTIQSVIDQGYNSKNNKYIRFSGLDKDLRPCTIMLMFSNGKNSHQIYFIYNDFKFYYNFFDNANFSN
ncbi:hypothetical protein [Chryseobacterium taiwanense]|uniref:Uncharacterized protein n=1 Tax=Chryseobacterium taiwanense TaxID=363331 RepID=A0A0B4CKE5_9FLAO|nr:hypothetical protein [Chryseobacterium taiwanense]KIC61724.1 hypothetical protein RM51_15105 [Chryseobacterium taiwanense]